MADSQADNDRSAPRPTSGSADTPKPRIGDSRPAPKIGDTRPAPASGLSLIHI